MAAYEDILAKAGYTADDALAGYVQGQANDSAVGEGSLSHNGDYKVQGVWLKGNKAVHLERNISPEPLGPDDDEEMQTVTTHPPVFVVWDGDTRVATVMKRDPEALEAVLSDLG